MRALCHSVSANLLSQFFSKHGYKSALRATTGTDWIGRMADPPPFAGFEPNVQLIYQFASACSDTAPSSTATLSSSFCSESEHATNPKVSGQDFELNKEFRDLPGASKEVMTKNFCLQASKNEQGKNSRAPRPATYLKRNPGTVVSQDVGRNSTRVPSGNRCRGSTRERGGVMISGIMRHLGPMTSGKSETNRRHHLICAALSFSMPPLFL